MSIGPRVSLASSNADRRSISPGAPIASGTLADIALPVGLFATVLDLGQSFEGEQLTFSIAPASDPLPEGLSFDGSAVLFGTPSSAVVRTLIFRASNSSGFVDRALQLVTFDLAFSATLVGLTDYPAFGPSAENDKTLSAVASDPNGPPLPTANFQWKTIESGSIPGATTNSYTPDAMAYDGETLYCTISAAPYPDADTTGAVIRYATPTVAMALEDEIFDVDTGVQTIDAAAAFAGDNLTWSIDGPQTSIDTMGLISIDTGSALSGEGITVTATNSGGSASITFLITIEDPDAVFFETAMTTTTLPVRGATFTFDRPVPVGYGINGDPIVIADEAFSIIDDWPKSEVVTNYIGNGMMVFEGDGSDTITSNSDPNGFDETWEQVPYKGQTIPYSPAKNVAPSRSGNGAISVGVGARKSFVKTVRNNEGSLNSIDEYVTLTVLPSRPAKREIFRPGSVYADQNIFGESDIDLSCLRMLTPPSGIPSVAIALGNLSPNASARQFSRWSGDLQRRIEDSTTRSLGATDQYSAGYAVARLYGCYLMHSSSTSSSDKLALAKKVIQIGLDVIAAQQANSNAFASGAGQWHGYHTCAYFAAFLLRDDTLLEAAQAIGSNMQSMPKWVGDEEIGTSRGWPSGNIGGGQWFGRTFDETDRSKPDWNGSGGRRGAEVPADSGYKSIALPIGSQELLPILLLQNGPSGISGYDAFLQAAGGNGRYNPTNDRAAAIAAMERWQSWRGREAGFSTSYKMKEFYDAWIGTVYGQSTAIGGDTIAAWKGVPDAPESEIITGAGDGSISYSYANKDQATETITQYDLAYSLDNIQFVTEFDTGAVGVKSGLLRGATHYFKMRAVSASGNGKWTRTGHRIRAGAVNPIIGQIDTTGSGAATAPDFTTNPSIFRETYPNQQEPLFTQAEANLGKTVLRLFAGVGYSTGFPAPVYSFDWKRNGISIGAPNQNTYSIDPVEDRGTDITCTVAASNPSSSVSHTTSTTSIANGNTFGSEIVFESDFDEDFFLDWGDEYLSLEGISLEGHKPDWQPNETEADGVTFSSPGWLYGDKDGGQHPKLAFTLSRSLKPNTTYEVKLRFIKGLNDWYGTGNNARFFIAPTPSSSTNEWFHVYTVQDGFTAEEIELDGATSSSFRFTTGATVLEGCKFWFEHRTAQGGSADNDLGLTYCRIRERP